MSAHAAFKAQTLSRSTDGQARTDRERDCLVLVLNHLQNAGFVQTAACLIQEARVGLSDYEVSDNINLHKIIKEYSDMHSDKFMQKPTFSRRACRSRVQGQRTKRRSIERPTRPSPDGVLLPPLSSSGIDRDSSGKKSQRVRKRPSACHEETCTRVDPSGITGFALNSSGRFAKKEPSNNPDQDCDEESKQWKAPPDLGDDPGLVHHLRRDIIENGQSVGWKDVVGLEDAKQLLKEAIVLPRLYPQLFSGIRAPWQSCLLYGLPGTGKTLLAKAVATESKATFFNVSASSLVSKVSGEKPMPASPSVTSSLSSSSRPPSPRHRKYRGESEKLVRVLFSLARHYAPSIIFFDEIDSIMSHRGGGGSGFAGDGSEHEGSRRMKTEILTNMDGLNSNNGGVFLLAATNLPWDLDTSFLRRMEKQIHVRMPSADARKMMIRAHLEEFSPLFGKDEVLSRCATATDGFSGSDIRLVCKEAAMRPLRRMLNQLQALGHGDQNMSLLLKRNPVTLDDYSDARRSMQPTSNSRLASQIDAWGDRRERFGAD